MMPDEPTQTIRLVIDKAADKNRVAEALRSLAKLIESGTVAGYNVVALRDDNNQLVGVATFEQS